MHIKGRFTPRLHHYVDVLQGINLFMAILFHGAGKLLVIFFRLQKFLAPSSYLFGDFPDYLFVNFKSTPVLCIVCLAARIFVSSDPILFKISGHALS